MSDIPKNRVGPHPAGSVHESAAHATPLDAELSRVLTDIQQNIQKAQLLAQMDWKQFSPDQLQAIQDVILSMLAGQLPKETLAQLGSDAIDITTLQKLVEYILKSTSSSQNETGDDSLKRPLGEHEGDSFLEPGDAPSENKIFSDKQKGVSTLKGELQGEVEGPLSTTILDHAPKSLTGTNRSDSESLSLTQLPNSKFKTVLDKLTRILDSTNPGEIIERLQYPKHRAELARELGISRGQLLGILYRLEMLQIGKGRNGEEALQLQHLDPLDAAGISLLTSLSHLRSLPDQELNWFYRALRRFKVQVAMRDLTHWMVSASHKRSQLVLEEGASERALSAEQAEELAYRWYLESRYWEILEQYRQEEERSRQGRGSKHEEEQGEESSHAEDNPIEIERDESRDDNLICFWISDHAPTGLSSEGRRHAYVCVDPKTGELIPQSTEAEIKRS